MSVKVAVIGLGGMGMGHVNRCRALGAEVVAVCDILPERLAPTWGGTAINIESAGGTRGGVGDAHPYADYRTLLRKEKDIQLVLVATPTDLHAQIAIAALKAGRHVFCEKPMARTARDAARMAQAAERAGRFLMVGHVLRFWPEYIALKQIIDDGRYGPIRNAYLRRFCAAPAWGGWYADAARSGSAALDLHIHDVDTVQWLFGPPSKVASVACNRQADGGVNHIVTRYELASGGAIRAEGGWDFPGTYPFHMAFTAVFEKAAVEYDSSRSPSMTIYEAGNSQPVAPTVEGEEGYSAEIRYALDCVAMGEAPTRITPAQSAHAVRIVEAELKSAATGRPATVR